MDAVGTVELDLGHDTLVNGPGEDIASVVVRVFTDEVDPARRGVHRAALAESREEFLVDFGLHVHNYVLFQNCRNHKNINNKRQ